MLFAARVDTTRRYRPRRCGGRDLRATARNVLRAKGHSSRCAAAAEHHLVRLRGPVDGDRLRVGSAAHFILIITIPFGIAALRIGIFALWPFGKTVVRRADAGAGSAIGNVIWFVLCGWWLALGHLITGVLLCVTLIGIPLGLAN